MNKPRTSQDTASTLITGRVIAGYGARVRVATANQETIECIPQTKRELVVCGDRVEFFLQADGTGTITNILPRQTVLERADQRGQKKALAANMDRLLIVTAHKPGFHPLNIDRYLVLAETIGVKPIIVLHKADLPCDTQPDRETLAAIYQALDYTLCHTSCKHTNGLDDLLALLQQHTGILLGESGAGKSSIIQKLVGDQLVRVGALSENSGLGTHTTTNAQLYRLPQGGELIDSPGVREFVIPNLTATQIRQGYRDINQFSAQCRFADCSHLVEPGCAVQQAVNDGQIHPSRWQTYQTQMNSL